MKLSYKILMIGVSCLLSAVLGWISHLIQMSIVDLSGRNMLGLSGLLYVLIPASFFFWGFILSIILVHINSLPISLLVSLFVSLMASFGIIKSAIEIYQRTDYFDKTYFQWDILQVISIFIIFPLIGFLIWLVKSTLINEYQIQ